MYSEQTLYISNIKTQTHFLFKKKTALLVACVLHKDMQKDW